MSSSVPAANLVKGRPVNSTATQATQPTLESPQEYYSTHGPITYPGALRHLYSDLPASFEELCWVDHGLVIHVSGGELYNYNIPEEDMAESDTREVEAILARI